MSYPVAVPILILVFLFLPLPFVLFLALFTVLLAVRPRGEPAIERAAASCFPRRVLLRGPPR